MTMMGFGSQTSGAEETTGSIPSKKWSTSKEKILFIVFGILMNE